ncbi:MAG: SpoIIE family protein phosphatase [Oscillospiraceae bacterium]|nr:SpoIIE family protein phosphatase [Oscillospiraceae bacterium]
MDNLMLRMRALIENKAALYLTKSTTAEAVYCAFRFILSFICAHACLYNGTSPFALGLIAAMPKGLAGLCGYIGALSGYLSIGAVWGLKYMAISTLLFATLHVMRDTDIICRSWFAPLCTALSTACIAFVYVSTAGFDFNSAVSYICEICLSAFCSYTFRTALSPRESGLSEEDDSRHIVSVMMLMSTVLLAVSGIIFLDMISIGRFLALLTALISCYKGGIGNGIAIGMISGMAFDAGTGPVPYYSFIYGFTCLVSSFFSRHGRLSFTVVFALCCTFASMFLWNPEKTVPLLYEVFLSCVCFVMLPRHFLSALGSLFPEKFAGNSALKVREYTRKKIESTAEAFRILHGAVRSVSGEDRNTEDLSSVFDIASESICRKCRASGDCWHREYQGTAAVLNDLTGLMLEKGRLDPEDFPDFFRVRCRSLRDFTAAINRELRAFTYRQQFKTRLQESLGAAYDQYADIADVLTGLSRELGSGIECNPIMERKLKRYLRGMDVEADVAVFRDSGGRLRAEIDSDGVYLLKRDPEYLDKLSSLLETRLCTAASPVDSAKLLLLEAEPYAISIGIASMRKPGQSTSGDRGTYFKTDEGILYLILSDGMGSGPEAAKASAGTVKILESFLRAGTPPETALRILNDLMLLKNEEDTISATVDLMRVNLFSGDAEIYKFGAAPTYIIRSGRVKSVGSKNLAAGLSPSRSGKLSKTVVKLSPGDLCAIMSDGIISGNEDSWLKKGLSEYDGGSVRELAKSILEESIHVHGKTDDMTILTLQLENRK